MAAVWEGLTDPGGHSVQDVAPGKGYSVCDPGGHLEQALSPLALYESVAQAKQPVWRVGRLAGVQLTVVPLPTATPEGWNPAGHSWQEVAPMVGAKLLPVQAWRAGQGGAGVGV